MPAHVDPDVVEQRILEQSMLLPAFGAVTGWASCRLFGANFFDGLLPDGRTPRPVPLEIGPLGQVRQTDGAALSRERLQLFEILVRHGIPCTQERRALFDEMRYAPDLRESVVSMDMMAAAARVSIQQMRDYIDEHPGWTGVPQARAALDLASEHSKSPNEVRTRLIWECDAGFPRPLVNQPVFDKRGRLLGIADLLDPVAGVVGEYDGAEHRAARRHSKDVAREELFRGSGLEYFKVTGPDMTHVPMLVARMEATRSRAKWLPAGRRDWTLELPPGWEQPRTLYELLEHRALMASLHAQYEQEGDPDIGEVVNL